MPQPPRFDPQRRLALRTALPMGVAALAGLGLAGCSLPRWPLGGALAAPERRENVVALTQSQKLVSFNAAQPGRIRSSKPVKGLQIGEQLLGLDYRAKNDTLYALGSSGQLYTVDTDNGQLTPVGGPAAIPLDGTEFGMDFNPTVDRIRVVSNTRLNLRVHPDTGSLVGGQPDTPLAYDSSDRHAGRAPRLVAAAYSYDPANPKVTTNYALDAATGCLVIQGSLEGATPVISPNTGRLFTVGELGLGTFDRAAFDIHTLANTAFAAITLRGSATSTWVELDVKTGRATALGAIAVGEPVRAIALESW